LSGNAGASWGGKLLGPNDFLLEIDPRIDPLGVAKATGVVFCSGDIFDFAAK
tara:strand:- start:230 stop:385 length:156 start_codon:yes stop_codon:yes gene_type:complete